MKLVDLLDTTPELVIIDGRPKHRWADGTILPVVSGGSGDDGAGGSGGSGGDDGKGGSGGDGGSGGSFTPITSQDDLNRIVQDRVRRAEEAARAGQPTAAELETLRQKAKDHDAAVAAGQSELERERTRAETAEAALAAAQASNTELTNTLSDERRRNAIVAAAAKERLVDPAAVAAVVALFDRDPNLKNAVTIDDAGLVTGADTAVKTLVEQNPYLSIPSEEGGTGGTRKTGSVDLGQGDRGDKGAETSEQKAEKRLKRMGIQTAASNDAA